MNPPGGRDARHRDTTPDLAFVRNVKGAEWINTWEDLGSNHFVAAATVIAGPRKPKGRRVRITEWDAFRGVLEEFEEDDIENIKEWTEELRACAESATKTVPEEANMLTAGSKLLHMWEAKSSMQRRLRIQRHNRNLRRKIAKLSKEIDAHANKIRRQQWQDSCDGLDHQLGAPKTWNILRHLLDPDGTKTAQKNKMSEILRRHEGTEDDLMKEIRKRYLGDSPPRDSTEYDGERNAALDVPITEAEVREVLLRLKTKSSPGPHGVTNKMLRNLGDGAQWKTAKVVMIPKPGKRPQLHSLRPISLTSCAGKLMEHVVLGRLNRYMEERELFPHTMVGFRPHLEMIQALKGTTYQVARLIARISNRNYGMKESNLMRLVQAFVMSRLAYVVPFMRLGVAEKSKLECIVRKAYKRALGLPDSTSNEKLAALGVHNTIDELIEAQRTAQLERLTRSATGRHILKSLGLRYETQRGEKVDVSLHIREMLRISPIPKRMHPLHDAKRIEARAKALGRTLKEEEGVAYVDAAGYKGRGAMAADCSVKTDDPETAEEVAVALALSMPGVRTTVCDSQSAVRNFAKGRVSPKTLRVLRGATCFGGRERVRLVWTLAHASLPGNEEAHDAARGLTVRAGTTSGAPVASSGSGRLVTFRDILDHYTDGRRSSDPRVQEDLVRLAEDAAGVQGILAVV
ncbi:hypothetical protein HPB47_012940 [Ixodes persulcatus]|uniref:Uncharacterized protein n=1 Tax=Ixodes persulcatus TaxID=34615 RepID=A0AC60NSA6_IXOPE|nr:hypothetical protein HPB47_012940 [Ixodes persulcatus]